MSQEENSAYVLSICIPFYNRFEVLKTNLKSIFKATSKEFEVVIVDNCSTINIEKMLDLTNPQLRLVKRKKAISGQVNTSTCIQFARGQFAMICLDKDQIRGEYIDDFIDNLKKHPNISGGFCTLSNKAQGQINIIKKYKIRRFGYLHKHPTGDFFLMRIMPEVFSQCTEKELASDWPWDILLAECATRGPMMQYEKKL